MRRDFLAALFAGATGFLEIRSLPGATQKFLPLPVDDFPDLDDVRDHYFGVAPRFRQGGTEADVEAIHALWLDVDWKYFGDDRTAALKRLQDLKFPESGPLMPSIIVDSGHGFHAYWLLSEPVKPAEGRQLMDALRSAINPALDKTSDPPRILRIPDTLNHKNGQVLPVLIIHFEPEWRWPVDMLRKALIDGMPADQPKPVKEKPSDEYEVLLEGVATGRRHQAAMTLIGHYVAMGLPGAELRHLMALWNTRNQPPLPVAELRRAIVDITRKHLLQQTPLGAPPHEPQARDEEITAIAEQFGIPLTRIIRIGGEGAYYVFYVGNHRVCVAAKKMLGETMWREAMTEAAERIPKPLPKGKNLWHVWANRMLAAAERLEPGADGTLSGTMNEWLTGFLEKHKVKEPGKSNNPRDTVQRGESVYISGALFRNHVNRQFDMHFTPQQFAQALIEQEFTPIVLPVTLASGKQTSARMWRVPRV